MGGIKYVNKYLIDPFGNKHKNVITFNGEEFSNAFPSNFCDIIICKSAAHFLTRFDHWLHQCCRILKPNGCLYIMAMSDLNLKEQWGKHVQRTFDESITSESAKWEIKNGSLPPKSRLEY